MVPIVPVMQLIHLLGTITGRKKFHKLVYILKTLGAPFREGFEYSLYGVYSEELRYEVSILTGDHLVSEEVVNKSVYIAKTDSLYALLQQYELCEVQEWFELAKKLNQYESRFLEGISTVFFLESRECVAMEQRKERLVELKPHLLDIADKCIVEADRLKADKITN